MGLTLSQLYSLVLKPLADAEAGRSGFLGGRQVVPNLLVVLQLDLGEPDGLAHSEGVLQLRRGARDAVVGRVTHIRHLLFAEGRLAWMTDNAHFVILLR